MDFLTDIVTSIVNERVFGKQCDKCYKYFSSNSNLKKHMNLVHDLSFFTQNHYFLLEAIKEVSDYKCPNCNKQFKDRSNYHKHMKLQSTLVINVTNHIQLKEISINTLKHMIYPK